MHKKIALSLSLLVCLQSPQAMAMEEFTDRLLAIAVKTLVFGAVFGGAIYYFVHYGNEMPLQTK